LDYEPGFVMVDALGVRLQWQARNNASGNHELALLLEANSRLR